MNKGLAFISFFAYVWLVWIFMLEHPDASFEKAVLLGIMVVIIHITIWNKP